MAAARLGARFHMPVHERFHSAAARLAKLFDEAASPAPGSARGRLECRAQQVRWDREVVTTLTTHAGSGGAGKAEPF